MCDCDNTWNIRFIGWSFEEEKKIRRIIEVATERFRTLSKIRDKNIRGTDYIYPYRRSNYRRYYCYNQLCNLDKTNIDLIIEKKLTKHQRDLVIPKRN